jgi:hypothetical protein
MRLKIEELKMQIIAFDNNVLKKTKVLLLLEFHLLPKTDK